MTHPFTPEYISMAKAAEEIQAMRPTAESFISGDWYAPTVEHFQKDYGGDMQLAETRTYWRRAFGDAVGVPRCVGDDMAEAPADYPDAKGGIVMPDPESFWRIADRTGVAFLPRLDQLLGMLGNPADVIEMLSDEDSNISTMPLFHRDFGLSDDWHETAIVVVMREKYGKIWRDEAWTKA